MKFAPLSIQSHRLLLSASAMDGGKDDDFEKMEKTCGIATPVNPAAAPKDILNVYTARLVNA